ncbi:hypothetical protein DAPPUDRAFT_315266 [Daphnia pulex]|uniref:GH18 domain-containing protein n=1 Tax=Daphnia pulex TaxID=6669 RepID=E9G989_DAPPU|nr:hypothetical protein DAPPUDRAFT_315266 [Daphnia pulex]|eukprot:EFX84098.1 hypothetical protein DAPPUDRAFT_315266 [Daphnia pulex]
MKIIFLALLLAVADCITETGGTSQRLVCYLNVQATNRTGDGAFSLENIDPYLCTHLIYAFTSDIALNSTSFGPTQIAYDKLLAPRVKNPKLKIMASIKSEDLKWDSSKGIENKVNKTVDYLKKYRLDGLDIYWNMSSGNYPIVNFFTAMRNAFDRHNLIFSLAVFTETNNDVMYFMDFVDTVDFISVLAYDLWRSTQAFWEANHPAPLYSNSSDGRTIDSLILYWLEHDTPAAKLNLGIPLYGSSWTILADGKTEPPASATWGPLNKHVNQIGQTPYYDICSSVKSSGWKVFEEKSNSTGPYAVSPADPSGSRVWVGYDDVHMVTVKSQYVRYVRGLGGATVWDLSQDDCRNVCGKGSYQLTAAISRTLGIPRPKSSSSASDSKQSSLSNVIFLIFTSGLLSCR